MEKIANCPYKLRYLVNDALGKYKCPNRQEEVLIENRGEEPICMSKEFARPCKKEQWVGMCDWRKSLWIFGNPVCSALDLPKDKFPEAREQCRYYNWTDEGKIFPGACRLHDYNKINARLVEPGDKSGRS